MSGFTKRALIRDPNVPIGQPAPLHVECECGAQVPIELDGPDARCECGIVYDCRGWIVERPAEGDEA